MKNKHEFRTRAEEEIIPMHEYHTGIIYLRFYDKIYSNGEVIHCLTKDKSHDLRT